MKFFKLVSSLFVAILGGLFVSCEETIESGEYSNWQERNEAYIDSIAKVAEANQDGKWMRILSFKLDSVDAKGNPIKHGIENCVYCYLKCDSAGTASPKYTDLVSVNYRGRLIPTENQRDGLIFDGSYKGEFNPAYSVPRNFFVDELIVGWSTVLMQMTKGDNWVVYIPSQLGYGAQSNSNIPENSTLIFDLNLVDFGIK